MRRMMVVEDNSTDAAWICEALKIAFNVTVDLVVCEKDFVDCLPDLAAMPPDLIVFDVMLRWANASAELERDLEEGRIPPEIAEKGAFLRAGLRCVARLRSSPQTAKIPYVLFTGLKENNFEEDVIHLEGSIITKSDDIEPLISAVRRRIGGTRA